MTDGHRCPDCGSDILDDDLTGLCRRCLLGIALEDLSQTPSLMLRCPQCHQVVDVPSETDLRDAVCEACGGRFFAPCRSLNTCANDFRFGSGLNAKSDPDTFLAET